MWTKQIANSNDFSIFYHAKEKKGGRSAEREYFTESKNETVLTGARG